MKEKRKPVLLLDVDGVLNAFPPDYEKRKIWLGSGGAIHPTRITKPFLEWTWKHFEVFWLTAWFDRANEIADWVGLPHRPHLGDPRDSGEYKLNAVKRHLGEHPGKVVWVEDGIGEAAKGWVAKRKNFLYVETLAREGVTVDQIVRIAEFAGVPRLGGSKNEKKGRVKS